MGNDEFILDHEPITRRINVCRDLQRISKNPLEPLLELIGDNKVDILSNDVSRFLEAYWFYRLSFERYLTEMSIAARYMRGPYLVRCSGGAAKVTPTQRKLADQRRKIARFVKYDLVNCSIHSRVLLDRTIGLAHHFLIGKKLLSFISFDEHKKSFRRFGNHGAYEDYIRTKTDWFEMPLKIVRDKFIVHASPKHMKCIGYPSGEWALDLDIILPNSEDPEKPLSKVRVIRVNALRLSLDIEAFLVWFSQYGVDLLRGDTYPSPTPDPGRGGTSR